MTAYTVQSDTFGLPPLDGPPPPPADQQMRGRFLAALRRDPPSHSTQNVHQQAQSFTNDVYIAVTAIMTAMSGATVCVMKRAAGVRRKSLTSNQTGAGESDWQPAESDHPLCRLFEYVNENQTIGDYLAEKVLCRCLFGSSVEYVSQNERTGAPKEIWNLRPNYLTHIPMSPDYPCGAWRYTVPGPFLWNFGAGSVTFDRRETIWHKYPHPIFPWDGYSPLTAGAKYIDFLNSIIDSRQMAMDHGFTPDVIVKMFGAGQSEMTRVMADLNSRYTGSNRGQKVMAVDAQNIEIEPLNITPDKMAYQESHKQAAQATQGIFGVNSMVTGQSEPGSYAAFYAALRAFRELKLIGEANSIGQHYTKHICLPRYGPDYRVEVKLPPLMDPDLQQRQWGTLTAASSAVTYTVNEIRASLDMPPMEGGDVTPAEFNQQLQMKQQQAQQQMQAEMQQQQMMQQGQGLPGLGGDAESAADPEQQGAQDAISGAVLESLGVRGGDGASETVLKAWTRFTTRTGGVGARNEAGTTLYGQSAEAALAGQNKPVGGGEPTDEPGTEPAQSGPQTHKVTYTVGTKTYTADVPGATEEEAHQVVTALGGKVVTGAKPTGGQKTAAKQTSEPTAQPGGDLQTLLGKPVDQLSDDEVVDERERLLSAAESGEDLLPEEWDRLEQVKKRYWELAAADREKADAIQPAGGKSPQPGSTTGSGTNTDHITAAADLDAGYAQRAEEHGAKSNVPGDKVKRIVRSGSKQYTEYESGMRYQHYGPDGTRTPHGYAANAPSGGQSGQPETLTTDADQPETLTPDAPLHPRAVPIAQRAKQQTAQIIPKLKPVAQSPAGQQAIKDVAKWGRIAADKHADLIAATKNLDRGAARDLFLTILAHVVRSLPVVGGVAAGATAAVGAYMRNQDRKQMQGAVREQGKATKELENARFRAVSLGVNPDDEPDDQLATLPVAAQRNTSLVPRPKNKPGAGTLPKRIGKGTTAAAVRFALKLNKGLSGNVARVTKAVPAAVDAWATHPLTAVLAARDQPPPVVNVTMPAQPVPLPPPPPVVHVYMPQGEPHPVPVVNVAPSVVHVAAPEVHVTPDIAVTATLPPRVTETTIERGRDDLISRIVQTEQDATQP